MTKWSLIPAPKRLKPKAGGWRVPPKVWILLGDHFARSDLFGAEQFALRAEAWTGSRFEAVGNGVSANPRAEIHVHLNEKLTRGFAQEYRLDISPHGIQIAAASAAGVFYAFQTLTQIIRQAAANKKGNPPHHLILPAVTIEDWPDFERRGIYHDCARGKIPTVETLLQLIDDLGHLKINEFQIYIENSFEFRKHPAMYDDTTPLTAEELLLLDAACRARHIDFVPSLTSLGHFEKILSRPPYRHLAEVEPEELKKAGVKTWSDQPWTLCTTDPQARAFLKELYAEFVPNFSSPIFNICCDESWDLGKGRSKKEAARIGVGQMYVEWVNFCNRLAKNLGKRIQMWGDIILNHPKLIAQLPKDATLLEWGYESHHKFDEHLKVFAQRVKGQTFYAAPGTTSWLSFAARTRNALGNIHAGAAAGLQHDALGVLTTDWGDNGHQQLLAVSILPFAYSAAATWNLASAPNPAIKTAPNWETGLVPPGTKSADRQLEPLLQAISLHVFEDPTRQLASLAYELGLTYERFAWQRFNGSLEWFLFREKWDFSNYVNRADLPGLKKVIAACTNLRRKFERIHAQHPDAQETIAEFIFTCDLIIHTCRRTLLRKAWLAADPAKRNPEEPKLRTKTPIPLPKSFQGEMQQLQNEIPSLTARYESLWLARNKPSRLADILAEFQRMQKEYKTFA